MKYYCTIYHGDDTFDSPEGRLGSLDRPALLVGRVLVRARNPREAAARAYVVRVGRKRARFLEEALQAPPALVEHETNPRSIARCLSQLSSWTGPCYRLDNMIDTWFIRVDPADCRPLRPHCHTSRRKLLRLLRSPSRN